MVPELDGLLTREEAVRRETEILRDANIALTEPLPAESSDCIQSTKPSLSFSNRSIHVWQKHWRRGPLVLFEMLNCSTKASTTSRSWKRASPNVNARKKHCVKVRTPFHGICSAGAYRAGRLIYC